MRLNLSRASAIAIATMLSVSLVAAAQQTKKQPSAGSSGTILKVDLDELEDHPETYLGKTVETEGEIDRVLGINLFTIDEKNWVDAEREMPIVVPDGFTAILKPDSPVRVTGTVAKVPIARIERRGPITDAKIRAEIDREPVLLATAITSATPAVAVVSLLIKEPAETTSPKSK